MQVAPLRWSDDILRRAKWTNQPSPETSSLARLVVCLTGCALFYGAVMGSYRGLMGQSDWGWQMLYSAAKVPMLLGITFAVSLPSFFVLNSLLGLRRDFGEAVRSLIATQAGFAIVLAACAPLTLFWYASTTGYQWALLFNGCMFALASVSSQFLLRGYYAPLIARNPKHRRLLWWWTGIYILVAIQLAWLLRPFIGAASQPVTFVRTEAWDNAYVMILRLMRDAVFH